MPLVVDDAPGSPLDTPALVPERARLVAAVTWSAAYQFFEIAASFAAMLILVRVIPPSEYGRAAAAVGLLALVHTFSAHIFVSHALQTPGDRRPDWSLYWTLACYTQLALFGLCHLLAAACWTANRYRPIAPLLHVAAFGILIEAPNEISVTMLRRDLALRRQKTVAAVSVIVTLAAMVAIGLAGLGAWAIILGGNVLTGIPFTIDLFFVRGWRPRAGWWRLPAWPTMRPAVVFGGQQVTGRLISSLRAACEAAVLPAALGFGAMGLLNRAQGFYAATLGRASTAMIDSIYPVLPRVNDDSKRFARRATVFLQMLLLLAVPGGLFIGLEGRVLSRVLYGSKWIAMDPLIWPGAVIGASGAAFASAAAVLLAAGRLRRCLQVDAAALLLIAPALVVAGWRHSSFEYAVTLAGCQVVATVLAFRAVVPLLAREWRQQVLYPPVFAGGLALVSGSAARAVLAQTSSTIELVTVGLLFAIVAVAVLIGVFPGALAGPLEITGRMRGFRRWLQHRASTRWRMAGATPVGALHTDQ